MLDTDVLCRPGCSVGRIRSAHLIALLAVGVVLLAGCGADDPGRGSRTPDGEPGEQSPNASPAATASPTPTPAQDAARTPADVVAAIAVPGFPGPVGVGFGAVWVAGHRNGAVHRIDPQTNRVVATIEIPDTLCGDFAFGSGAVWAMNCQQGGVSWIYRVDPQTNRVTGRRPGITPVFADGSLWVVDDEETAVLRIEPQSDRVQARIRSLGVDTGVPLVAVGAGFDSVWLYSDGGAVARIATATNSVTAVIPLRGSRPSGPAGRGFLFGGPMAVAGGAVWLSNPAGLFRIDPASNRARRLPIRAKPLSEYGHISVTAGDGSVWMRASDRHIVAVDPRTARVTGRRPASGGGGNIEFGFGSLWVANAADDSAWRVVP